MNNSDNKENVRSEQPDHNLEELLRRAEADAREESDELINLADDIHALTDDYEEDKESLLSVPVSDYDTSSTASYEDQDIQVLEDRKSVV